MNGWVKIHRELFEHPIWKNSTPEQKVVLITLIGMANHEPNRWEWNGEIFEVERGQMITSLESIKESCGKGVSIQNIRTALVRFEKLNFLTSKSTNKGRLITIENYSKWQDVDAETNNGDNKQLTSTSQATNKHLTTNKNDKNDKKDKNNIYRGVPEDIREPFMKWADMRKRIKKPITTEETVNRAINKLNKLSSTTDGKIELIRLATERCWLSFYPPKQEEKQTEPKRYKEFEKEEYEQDDFEAVEMPEDIKRKRDAWLGGML